LAEVLRDRLELSVMVYPVPFWKWMRITVSLLKKLDSLPATLV